MKLSIVIKTALSVVFFISIPISGSGAVKLPIRCQVLNEYIQVVIERKQSAGELVMTTQSGSTIAVNINGGFASYGLDKKLFPLELVDLDTNKAWVITETCLVYVTAN